MISTETKGVLYVKANKANVYFFIMAGGAGTRFWPLSTKDMPKQFLPLFNNKSLLELTIDRISGNYDINSIFILTRESYRDYIINNYPIPQDNVIGEMYPRDTSASVSIAVYSSMRQDEESICIILPSDHIIDTADDFCKDLDLILNYCADYNGIYTIGIKPAYPAVSYGYLEYGESISDGKLFRVNGFKEKPCLENAEKYLKSGNYFWNSGIFVFKAKLMAKYIEEHLPSHVKIRDAVNSYDISKALAEVLYQLPKISVDYAIMEKVREIYSISASFCWNDMGGWLSLKDYLQKDESGNYSNIIINQMNSEHNIIYSKDKNEKIVCAGINDLVIVRADNRTLIIHKDQIEDIKKITETIE